MRRIRTQIDRPGERALQKAGEVLRAGGIVAFPTETVYGLCVDATQPDAVRRLYEIKGRQAERLCAYLLADAADAAEHARPLPALARRLADAFWPGPLTLVVPGQRGGGVGLRLPVDRLPRALPRAAGRPLLQTSANKSGEPAALNPRGVYDALGDAIDLVLDGGRTRGGKSSTVVACDGKRYAILREGAISGADIARAAVRRIVAVCSGNICRSPTAAAMLAGLAARELDCAVDDLAVHGLAFESFGTIARAGHPATPEAIRVAGEMGFDLADHRSRPFRIDLVDGAAHVYALAQGHANFLTSYFAERPGALELLDPDGKDIADPYGQSVAKYRKSAQAVLDACRARLPAWLPEA